MLARYTYDSGSASALKQIFANVLERSGSSSFRDTLFAGTDVGSLNSDIAAFFLTRSDGMVDPALVKRSLSGKSLVFLLVDLRR